MGKIKDLLFSKMEAKGLTEAQEKQVMDFLEANMQESKSLEDNIDWAIEQVLICISKDATIAELHEKLHTLANQYQVKYATMESINIKLVVALSNVLNFNLGAWPDGRALLEELENGTCLSDQEKPGSPTL